MSYVEIISRCESDPIFFLGCICWAAFVISLFAAVGWRFGKALIRCVCKIFPDLSVGE